MAKFERELRAKPSELAKYLNKGIQASGDSVELVDSSSYRVGNAVAYFMMYDKFYLRTSSRTALSVLVIGSDDDCTVTAISAGGGNGSVLNFTWGVEKDFVSTVETLMDEYK